MINKLITGILILGLTLGGCVIPPKIWGGIRLEDYNGVYRQTIDSGSQHLRERYPDIKFRVNIYEDDESKIDTVRVTLFGTSEIDLVILHLANDGWRRDFNKVADAQGLPRIQNDHENALFLLFHEFRHIMQKKSKTDGLKTLADTPENRKNILPYRFILRESDADWFAFTELEVYRN